MCPTPTTTEDELRNRPVVWVVVGCVVLAVVAGEVLAVSLGEGLDLAAIGILAFPIVGALIASRQPSNAISWILVGIGVVAGLSTALAIYAHYALPASSELAGGAFALALEQHLWVPAVGLPGTFLILLFPDGRLPTPRWRPWAYFCALALVLSYVALTILPGSFSEVGYPDVRNPLGIDALEPVTGAVVTVVALIPIAMVGCAVALIRRFRRSSGLARVQLKWLAAAAGLVAATYLGAMVLNFAFGDPDPPWLVILSNFVILTFVLIPIAIGIAIFRHRLYDIDVIVNRTLVYGTLTATLTGAYFVLVTTLQGLLRPLAGQSELAVAGSTLVVAAIFRPVRGRIQALVDRRFYRTKFVAATTLESFAARLRDEVDLETLTSDLLAVVDLTVKPATSSLWLRPLSVVTTGPEAALLEETVGVPPTSVQAHSFRNSPER